MHTLRDRLCMLRDGQGVAARDTTRTRGRTTVPADQTAAQERELLSYEVAEHDRASVVRLTGELDAHQAPALRSLLAEQVLTGPGNLVLDLSGLTFIDSSGLAALIAAHKGTQAAGTSFVLAGPGAAVTKVLALTGLRTVLATAPSVEEALASLPQPG